jgi:multiphosphoryl transfer protein
MTETLVMAAPCDGWCMPLTETPDAVFSAGLIGEDGVAIDPTSGTLLAPCAAEVVAVPESAHAVTLRSASGIELLIHVGIDTVELRGRGFTPHVTAGQRVTAGDRLLSFDLDQVALGAPSLVTPVVITNLAGHTVLLRREPGPVRAGEPLLTLAAAAPAAAAGVARVTPPGTGTRVEVRLAIPLAHGLHARPAALIVQALKGHEAEVELLAGERRANARSVVSIMALGARQHDQIVISAAGREAEAAVAAVRSGLEDALRQEAAARRAPAAPPTGGAGRPAIVVPDHPSLAGSAAVPGFAVGRAARIERADLEVVEAGSGIALERAELDRARSLVAARLARLAEVGGGPRREIAAAHLEFLADPVLDSAAQRRIEAGKSAGFAWREAVSESIAALLALADERLRERIDDLRDIEAHVLLALRGEARPMNLIIPEHAVLIADELLPSELIALDRGRLEALCLAGGGATSHVAILAAAMDLPMLVGLGARLGEIANGAPLIVDADHGQLLLRPDPAALAAAQLRVRSMRAADNAMRQAAQRDCHAADGTRIEVLANVGNAADGRTAIINGAEGCGLLRTEFLFLDRVTPPSEDEQRIAYQEVADALAGRPLVLRLLDVGGDKPLSYLPFPPEDNPALGLRGIRTGLAQPDLLRTQLRAALAVRSRELRILVPMVTEVDELLSVHKLVVDISVELGRTEPVALGAMVETPAAAVTARQLAAHVDFLSIGSNDLSQYALAMDRGHAGLAGRIDALHPAVLALIGLATSGAASKPVAVCGGMASDPLAIPLLLGLGVRELSVVPIRVPAVKALVSRLEIQGCRALALAALDLGRATEVRALVRSWLGDRARVPGGE